MQRAVLELPEPYALEETLFSGQAFRWARHGRSVEGFLENQPVRVTRRGRSLTVRGRFEGDLEGAVAAYLRVSDPMGQIYRDLGKDARIRAATERWSGLHLLAQQPFETTVSFIASSASNIPKIARSIEKLCRSLGEKKTFDGRRAHAFPTASRLARADLATLRGCEFGYRARYIKSAARAVAEGQVDLDRVARMPTDRAQETLVEGLDGVGPKVAACVLLFAMGKDDAFPVDRWVQRCVSEWYFDGARVTPKRCEAWGREYFGPRAGYAQQYLFHERRGGRVRSRPASRAPSG